ncbi:hypothetical protein BGZ99_000514 [Dissophora globulifera]|uniref:Endoplasmic reticulum junction formation protein lunapark n=1 Tax=Dissophora globulifera TaxID=979702 RepID=A0A9P6V0G5_9FUNG|nr:hypothetical protein BGZ99_000514 [Dissophora globulifera]
MGGIISRLRQNNDSDYEKILSDLDSNIRKAELRLSAITIREKRLMGLWLVYSAVAWLGYTAIFVLYLHQQYQDEPQQWAMALVPILMGLPVIYSGRSTITVWYKRKKTNEESELAMLRADQRLKVEELKKKTAYYSTKTLLERYDSSSQQRSNGARATGPDGRPLPGPQNGQPKPQQPNMMDPGMRQRQGLGVTNAPGLSAGPGRPVGMSSGMQPQQQQLQPGLGPQHAPRGPQGQYNPQQPQSGLHPSSAGGSPYQTERRWFDKIVDVIVGDEGPDTRYALICGQCYAHNGLALPQEIDDMQYICPKCNFFNPSRRRTRLNGVPSPSSPEMTLLQAQARPLPASREPSPSPAHRSPLPDHHHRHAEHQDHRHHQQQHGGPRIVDDRSPQMAPGVPSVEAYNSEGDDIEFVNNWNDSDAEGANHDEGDEDEDGDSEDAQGYSVGQENGSGTTASTVKKTSSGVKTRATTASEKKN